MRTFMKTSPFHSARTGLVLFISMYLFCAGLNAETKIFYANGSNKIKAVSLTFDDGPGPNTEKVIAILKKYNVKATFFMEGSLVKNNHAIVKQVETEGHEIGSHLYSHPDFYHYKKPDYKDLLVREIDKTQAEFNKIGLAPVLLRMPHGYVKDWVKETAKDKGLILINWSFGCDWTNLSKEDMAKGYIKAIRPGAIFLMHDGGRKRDKTLYSLELLLNELKKLDYQILTVSALINLK